MLGVSRSDCRIWRACWAKALLASIWVLNGAGGSLTKLHGSSSAMDSSQQCRFMSTYRTAKASMAHTVHGSRERSRMRRSRVGVWWKLHL